MGVGVILGFVVKLFIFTKYLKPEEIGLITVMLDAANLFASLIPLGSQKIFIRYLPYFRDKSSGQVKGLSSLGLILTLIGGLIFIFLFLIFQGKIVEFYSRQAPLLAKYSTLLIPLVIFRVIYIFCQSFSRAHKKIVLPLAVKEIFVRIMIGLMVIGLVVNWYNFDGMMIFFISIYFLSSAITFTYLKKLNLINFSLRTSEFRNKPIKDILKFGFFSIFTGLAGLLIRNIDSIMVSSLASLQAAGIYGIAFFIGNVIEMPRKAVSQSTAPFIADAMAKKKLSKISELYKKAALNQFLAGSLLLICIWSNIDYLLEIIPNGQKYISGKYIVLFIGLGKLVDMTAGINTTIIQNSSYYKFNLISTILLGILAVSSNIILIPILGMNGAAIASLISLISINLIKLIFIKVKLSIHPFNIKILKSVIIAFATYLALNFIPETKSAFLNIFFNTTFTISLFIISIIYFKLSKEAYSLFIRIKNKFTK